MAKYSRYDPRNKKKDRNKSLSINKDLSIRDAVRKAKFKEFDDRYKSDVNRVEKIFGDE
jgi:hypothetical protein